MGDGLKRVAKLCGGLTATDGRTTVRYGGDGRAKDRDWRPIASAPRDGTRILIWDGHAVELGSWLVWDDGTGDWVDGECLPLRPTHWCELPAPPGD